MAVGKLVSRSGVTLSVKAYSLVITYTSLSGGPFTVGETVTGGTSSATGVVVYDAASDTELLVANVSGTFQDAETITGGTSGTTATTSGAPANAWLTSYVTFARPKNSISVSDSRGTQTITDFDTAENDFFDTITDGRTGSISWTSNHVTDDSGYYVGDGAYKYNLDARVKVATTSRDGNLSETYEYEGIFSDRSITFNESGIAEASWTFNMSDEAPFS